MESVDDAGGTHALEHAVLGGGAGIPGYMRVVTGMSFGFENGAAGRLYIDIRLLNHIYVTVIGYKKTYSEEENAFSRIRKTKSH